MKGTACNGGHIALLYQVYDFINNVLQLLQQDVFSTRCVGTACSQLLTNVEQVVIVL
jgi:hypothetical protein